MGRFLGRNYPPIFQFREGIQILNIDNCPPLIEWGDSWGIRVYSVTTIGTHHTRSCSSLKMGRSRQKDTCPISKINVKMGRYWSKYHSLMSKREGFGKKHPLFVKSGNSRRVSKNNPFIPAFGNMSSAANFPGVGGLGRGYGIDKLLKWQLLSLICNARKLITIDTSVQWQLLTLYASDYRHYLIVIFLIRWTLTCDLDSWSDPD